MSSTPIVFSLCIPFAHANITKQRVKDALEGDCQLGKIASIDAVTKTTKAGKKIQRFFVHFSEWNPEFDAEKERLMSSRDEKLRIVYDDPWWWDITAADPKFAGGFTKKNFDGFKDARPKAFVKKPVEKSPASSGGSSTDHLKIDIAIASPTGK